MGRDADRRASSRIRLQSTLRKAEEEIADIEAERPGTALLQEAREMLPALQGAITQCRAMPAKTLTDIEAARRVADHVERAAVWVRIAARDYPSWNFLMNAASYCGMATAFLQCAATKKAAAGKGGTTSQRFFHGLKEEFLAWHDANRARFPTKDVAAEEGAKKFGLASKTLRDVLANR